MTSVGHGSVKSLYIMSQLAAAVVKVGHSTAAAGHWDKQVFFALLKC